MSNSRSIAVLVVVLAAVMAPPVAAEKRPAPETVRDRLWMWAHPAGVYNDSYLVPLGRKSTIEPAAAVEWMGLRNVVFVHYLGQPKPPLESYYQPFEKLDRVYWSLVGASGQTSESVREHVFRLAQRQPNLVGFVLDDFFHGNATGNADPTPAGPPGTVKPFDASLTPAQLRELRQKLPTGRKLPIMSVVYTGQISPRAKAHLDEVDQVSLWTWRPADLVHLEANLAALEKLIPGKPIFLGCYTYDFADSRTIPMDLMRRQADLGLQWLKQGRIQGIIFLATANVDVGLEAVTWTRDWIVRVGEQRLAPPGPGSR
jgi:hypothetical protein